MSHTGGRGPGAQAGLCCFGSTSAGTRLEAEQPDSNAVQVASVRVEGRALCATLFFKYLFLLLFKKQKITFYTIPE